MLFIVYNKTETQMSKISTAARRQRNSTSVVWMYWTTSRSIINITCFSYSVSTRWLASQKTHW